MQPGALWSALTDAAPGWLTPVYPLLSALHIGAIGVLLGAIVALDVQLLRARPLRGLSEWAAWLAQLAAAGLAAALLSGFLLFSVQPDHYLDNPAFRWKLLLIGAGVANAWWVHRLAAWRALLAGAVPATSLKWGALLSLAFWLGALVAGRYIAFV